MRQQVAVLNAASSTDIAHLETAADPQITCDRLRQSLRLGDWLIVGGGDGTVSFAVNK